MSTNQKLGHKSTWAQIRAHIDKCIDKTSGCWEWIGSKDLNGYGRLYGTSSHRLSYEAHIGPIFKGMDIDHICRNHACCNPKHLEPVTRQENLRRGIGIELQKVRANNRRACSKGHELTVENTYIRPSDGVRQCRTCRADKDKESRAAKKDAINARKREWRKAWRAKGVRK
jgi:HNH endonuclease